MLLLAGYVAYLIVVSNLQPVSKNSSDETDRHEPIWNIPKPAVDGGSITEGDTECLS